MNEFTIHSFEEYLSTVRNELGDTTSNGKQVRRYFRGQSKRALDGYDPPHVSQRIRAQDGVLLACQQPLQTLDEKDYLEIVIDQKAHDEIRRRLDQYGVFDKQLFPDLDGIAKWLKYRVFEINGTT